MEITIQALNWIKEFLGADTNVFSTVFISTLISLPAAYFFRTRENRHRLATEYEYEQRKKLRELIGSYHGRLLNASNSLNYRLWNLYENHDKNWLDVNGNWSKEKYYYISFIYRFLNLFSLIRSFEREAIFVDSRISGIIYLTKDGPCSTLKIKEISHGHDQPHLSRPRSSPPAP